jgi:hypothetical protein
MVTGTEGGTVNGTAVYGTDGAYAVVQLQKGALKIVEVGTVSATCSQMALKQTFDSGENSRIWRERGLGNP